eukprot:TRINITY_DN1713_c0_g1_i1.p1 TRINITY_DN1713_c0_g1~~TRINITY_DN1713_c0_g1_i1.p1  ORF type:complete len:109 (-),score=21.23 TRINITY_DN1713_c0_g1_i1:266-592(-)
MAAHNIYRQSTLGQALEDALDELSPQKVPEDLVEIIKQQFDKSMQQKLAEKAETKGSFTGRLKNYNFCDNVWTFDLEDFKFETDKIIHIKSQKVRIVACDGRTNKGTN